jgi:hypothetical protein
VKKRVGIGVVVRDDCGDVEAAKTKSFSSVAEPNIAEALGAWHAVIFGCERGFSISSDTSYLEIFFLRITL